MDKEEEIARKIIYDAFGMKIDKLKPKYVRNTYTRLKKDCQEFDIILNRLKNKIIDLQDATPEIDDEIISFVNDIDDRVNELNKAFNLLTAKLR